MHTGSKSSLVVLLQGGAAPRHNHGVLVSAVPQSELPDKFATSEFIQRKLIQQDTKTLKM